MNPLTFVRSFVWMREPIDTWPIVKVKNSEIFSESNQHSNYVSGAGYGGELEEFFKMVHYLDNATNEDLKKNILPIWHDESYINYYINVVKKESEITILDPSYGAFGSGLDLEKHNPKIYYLDKDDIDEDKFREEKFNQNI